jgi:serine O-acetyltransferase
MSFLELLKSDLRRQYELSGKAEQISNWTVVKRLLHPRFMPLVFVRLSQAAAKHRWSVISKLCGYLNIVVFGIEVAPACQIGPGLFLPHTVGTVIGAWKIGSNVTVFQNVTLGALEADMGWNVKARPEIGDNVILGAGSKVLGGILVAENVVVGANSVVLESVGPSVVVAGVPARIVKILGS